MDSSEAARFEQAKKFIQEYLSAVTDKPLPQLKLYLKSLEKQIGQADAPGFLADCTSLTDLLNHTVEGKGKTALHFACARGDLEVVRLLVEDYKADIHIKDSEKYPAFFTAVQHGHLELVRYFVEELKQPVNATVEGDITPLHLASSSNFCEIIAYLLQRGANKEALSIYGKPLNWAVGSNRTEATLQLLEAGVDPNGDLSGPYPAPIIIAVDVNNQQIIDALIQKGADLNVKDPKGYSLLHLVCEVGNIPLVRFFLEKGLDVNYSAEGKTCLYLAFENKQYAVVEVLKSIINKDEIQAIE